MRRVRKLETVFRLAFLFASVIAPSGAALVATVPIGPPTGLSDPLPPPLRTRWVDRCGRGTVGTCGSVTCADSGDCTNQNAPCCTLHYAAGRTDLRAGDRIWVRAGADDSEVYNELDSENGKWGYVTLAPFVKGTALAKPTPAGAVRRTPLSGLDLQLSATAALLPADGAPGWLTVRNVSVPS